MPQKVSHHAAILVFFRESRNSKHVSDKFYFLGQELRRKMLVTMLLFSVFLYMSDMF